MYEDTMERLVNYIDLPLTPENCEKFGTGYSFSNIETKKISKINKSHIEDGEVARIVHRHRYVVEKMALGILEFKESLDEKDLLAAEDKIHYFLDRFFMSRFAANVLCHQHCKNTINTVHIV